MSTDKLCSKKHAVDKFLIVPINLIQEIGADAAIIYASIKYWCSVSGKEINGQQGKWIYNSLEDWQKQFPNYTQYKLRKIFSFLEQKKLIKSKKVNASKWNHTKWFSVTEQLSKSASKQEKKFSSISTDRSIENQQIIKQKKNYTKNILSNTADLDVRNGKKKEILNKCFSSNEYTGSNTSKATISNTSIRQLSQPETRAINAMITEWDKVFHYAKRPIKITKTGKRNIRLINIWKQYFTEDIVQWRQFAIDINSSRFLMGEKNGFKPIIDWLLSDETIARIQAKEFEIGDRVPDNDRKRKEKELQQVRVEYLRRQAIQQKQRDNDRLISAKERLRREFTKKLALKRLSNVNDVQKNRLYQEYENYLKRVGDPLCVGEYYKNIFKGGGRVMKTVLEEGFHRYFLAKNEYCDITRLDNLPDHLEQAISCEQKLRTDEILDRIKSIKITNCGFDHDKNNFYYSYLTT